MGSTSLNILQTFLEPSQDYRVKVRSLVFPGRDSDYGGIPSRWSDPVGWTSDEGNLLNQQKHICRPHIQISAIFMGITSCCSLYWLRGKRRGSQWVIPSMFSVPTVTLAPTTLIYLATIAFVTTVFFTLYCTIPACRRSFIYL